MVRVAGLKGQQLQDVELRSADGLTPAQQLAAIVDRGRRADATSSRRLARSARRTAREAGIDVLDGDAIDARGRRLAARRHFREQIFPILTPQALDPAHPFPFIPNQGLEPDLRSRPPVRRRADPRAGDDPADAAALRAPAGRGGALCRDRDADQALLAPAVPRLRRASARPRSASCATATSRSRKRPRISSAISPARSSAAAAAA